VSVPRWLGAKHDDDDVSVYRRKRFDNPEKATFILEALFKRLRRQLKSVKPEETKRSRWSDYFASNNNYSTEHFAAKEKFVQDVFREFKPRRVLDAGCNDGHFSIIAAGNGAEVVAIDYDPVVIGRLWRRCVGEQLDILPLVVNLARPSPAVGWRNSECLSFLDRSRGRFDTVLMLAVIHHMMVTERIPLEEVISLAAELVTGLVVIEYVDPADSMFRRLVRGRDSLHADLTVERFESACRTRFDIVRTQHLNGTSRWIYLLRKRV
jgi:2-polyprenyl-3-methyl-5-hydroxy-6-metoxy-1,4-benzoquinol methylase